MTAPKHTPATAYARCIIELEGLIDVAEDLDLDEIAVESLRTAIHAMWVQPELYEALEGLIDAVTDIRGIDMEGYCPRQLEAARAALATARGESNG